MRLLNVLGLDTSDEWIRERNGIKRRIPAGRSNHIRPGYAAAQKALD